MDWQFILYTLLKIVGVLVVLMPMIAYSVMAERKISAAIQGRLGPNRVGPWGLLQPLADGLKFLLKEDFTPAHVRKAYFWLAPVLSMTPAFLVVAVIPYGTFLGAQKMLIADLNIGILFTFAIVSLSVYGIVLAGYAANSKYPFLGGIRSSAQMISYEIAMGLSVVPVFMLAAAPFVEQWAQDPTHAWYNLLVGTSGLNLNRVVAYQADGILGWLVFKQPMAFIIFMVAIFAETNRLPFDLPESETELVGGYHTEYSSMKFALFFLGEYAAMIAGSALIVVLFLGGCTLPFWGLDHPAGSVGVGVLQIGIFIAKLLALVGLMVWVRWTLPRFRYDQLMNLGWRVFVPLALANIVLTATILWMMQLGSS